MSDNRQRANIVEQRVPQSDEAVRALVQEQYGRVAAESAPCCGPACCDGAPTDAHAQSRKLGYSDADLQALPEEADLGLGCGNPTAIAALQPGEVVVDLGSGPGLDALIAAERVGSLGRVIGVDMTPEMLGRARANAVKAGQSAVVEFREGLIEALPIVSDSVDVVMSNCVINLSPDKLKVFAEAVRVLKPGGRLAVSDILLTQALPPDIAELASAYVGCVAGAALAGDYFGAIREAGFVDVRWTRVPAGELFDWESLDPMLRDIANDVGADRMEAVAETIYSYHIEARKP